MSSPNICDPIAHRFVDRFLKSGLPGGHRHDCSAEEFHPGYIQCLPFHVGGPHINDAFTAESRRHGGSGYAMLAGTGFGDDPLLPHPASQQDLTKGIVDLMSAGME